MFITNMLTHISLQNIFVCRMKYKSLTKFGRHFIYVSDCKMHVHYCYCMSERFYTASVECKVNCFILVGFYAWKEMMHLSQRCSQSAFKVVVTVSDK